MITVDNIADNEHFEYTGDVTVTGDIGKNATVIIKNGSLIVRGGVGEKSDLTLSSEKSVVVINHAHFSSSSTVFSANTGYYLQISGNVGDAVKITTTSASIEVTGTVGKNVQLAANSGDITAGNVDIHSSLQTNSGSISTGDVGNHASLKTTSGSIHSKNVGAQASLKTTSGDVSANQVGTNTSLHTTSGNIRAGNVADGAILKTINGDAHAGEVGANASLTTMNGDIRVTKAHPSAKLSTMTGSIYENGTKRSKSNPATPSFSSHFSFSGSGVNSVYCAGGRIIVNGQDVSQLMNQAGASSAVPTQPPIRFAKK